MTRRTSARPWEARRSTSSLTTTARTSTPSSTSETPRTPSAFRFAICRQQTSTNACVACLAGDCAAMRACVRRPVADWAKAAGVGQFLFISSAGIYKPTEEPPHVEGVTMHARALSQHPMHP